MTNSAAVFNASSLAGLSLAIALTLAMLLGIDALAQPRVDASAQVVQHLAAARHG